MWSLLYWCEWLQQFVFRDSFQYYLVAIFEVLVTILAVSDFSCTHYCYYWYHHHYYYHHRRRRRRRPPGPGGPEEEDRLPRLRPRPLRLLELDELLGDENPKELGIGLGGV